ncbi:PREDICTED: uncharacterized protein LOC18590571 [Theobroma cacao]|uniref:Uncharacterized protein LOC18590571 n=1 Tax=Theobroma cacao TaxID=3641 RepID=A0AB32USR1_THECC|nr:PREDICTED: uncharacterized protein LOC18590571 [Theobroma cacao]
MATTLANRAATNQTIGLSRLVSNFFRNLSTASSTQNPRASSSSATKKPKRKKKKNLFEVAQFLPNWGLGYHMAKTHWTDVSYQITKVNLYKDGRHGKAWGVVHKYGMPAADAPTKVSGVHKRCWRYLPHLSKPEKMTPHLKKPTENAPKPEAQVA